MNWFNRRIDWRKPLPELSRRLGVDYYELRTIRRRFFRMLRRRDLTQSAKDHGVSPSHIVRMRNKYGVTKDPKKTKPKKSRPPRPPGRTHSEGLREYVLSAIDGGAKQFKDIKYAVLVSWGSVSDRSLYGALSHLHWEKKIMYTVVNHVRMYTRVK